MCATQYYEFDCLFDSTLAVCGPHIIHDLLHPYNRVRIHFDPRNEKGKDCNLHFRIGCRDQMDNGTSPGGMQFL
jgi:hypothetical protein